jgi:hypothetical protein
MAPKHKPKNQLKSVKVVKKGYNLKTDDYTHLKEEEINNKSNNSGKGNIADIDNKSLFSGLKNENIKLMFGMIYFKVFRIWLKWGKLCLLDTCLRAF